MLTYIVVAFGLVVVLQLWGINQRLAGMQSPNEELNKITNELQWHKDSTFAHNLKEALEEVPKDILKQLEWHKDFTFAHDLRESLEEVPKDIVEELQWFKDHIFAHEITERLQEISKTVTDEIQAAAKDILNTLSTIESNTSRE
jgi:hypothetical protein